MKRIVDNSFYKQVRQQQGEICLWGLAHQGGIGGPCSGPSEVHHILYRGRGGGDLPENAIVLCRSHHRFVHDHNIDPQTLQQIVSRYVSDIGRV